MKNTTIITCPLCNARIEVRIIDNLVTLQHLDAEHFTFDGIVLEAPKRGCT